MQKIRMDHQAKFRDKNKCFAYVLFPVCPILRGILTSGIMRARLIIEIWIHSADACILALNKLPAYKSAGKRQSGRKKSIPILVLPIDTCCSPLSIFDRSTICHFSGCEKTKLQTFPQRKTKWKSRFSAKWCWFEVKSGLYLKIGEFTTSW